MLFKTDEEWFKYSAFNKHFKLEAVTLDLEDALNIYVLPFLSKEQYDDLEEAYNTAYTTNTDLSTLSPANSLLLHEVRRCLGGFAAWLYSPKGAGQMTSGGFMESSGVNDNQRSASKWRTEAFQTNLLRRAWNSIDKLLKFLEANKADYELWQASTCYTIFKECFINTTADFNRIKNINNSTLMFYKMRDVMIAVESQYILPVLHTTLYTSLKIQVVGDTVTAANNTILTKYIKPAVAFLTYSEALKDNIIAFDSTGVTVPTGSPQSNELGNNRDGASMNALLFAAENAASAGKSYLAELKKYLDTHLADFADYTSDTDYVKDELLYITNDRNKKSFYL